MKNLYLFPVGRDRSDRPVYVSESGNAVVDIDYQRSPRTDLRTKYPPKEAYYGEPDCRLSKDLRPIFIDDLVREVNERLEKTGSQMRFTLLDGRLWYNADVMNGDDFLEISTKFAAFELRIVILEDNVREAWDEVTADASGKRLFDVDALTLKVCPYEMGSLVSEGHFVLMAHGGDDLRQSVRYSLMVACL